MHLFCSEFLAGNVIAYITLLYFISVMMMLISFYSLEFVKRQLNTCTLNQFR